MTMREMLNQNSCVISSRESDYAWDNCRRADYGWDVENKLNNYFYLVEALTERVAALEELCKNFKKVLDIKTDKDLMKFLEDFGVE